jgi:hypothetical protein
VIAGDNTGNWAKGTRWRLRVVVLRPPEDVRVLVSERDKAEKTFEGLGRVEIVDGAFDDEAVLAKAFDGVDVAFLAVGRHPRPLRGDRLGPPRSGAAWPDLRSVRPGRVHLFRDRAVAEQDLGPQGHVRPGVPEDRRSALLAAGTSEWSTELLLSLETSVEAGQMSTRTTAMPELLGHERRTVEEFLIENAARFKN